MKGLAIIFHHLSIAWIPPRFDECKEKFVFLITEIARRL